MMALDDSCGWCGDLCGGTCRMDPDQRRRAEQHTGDDDCELLPDDTCAICGVYHGEPCAVCGGRGFHDEECTNNEQEGTNMDKIAERHIVETTLAIAQVDEDARSRALLEVFAKRAALARDIETVIDLRADVLNAIARGDLRNQRAQTAAILATKGVGRPW